MEKPVNLLWTSGWDSTFRLLDLVIVQQRVVQPYYIISRSRQTCELEMQTMDKIKHILFEKFPQTKQLLLPTIYKERDTIKPNEEITQQYKRLLTLKHLGDQHEYLSRFAHELEIHDLELCIDTFTPGFFHTYVRPYLIKETDGNSFNYRLADEPSNPDLNLFKYHKFPIHELSKLDLEQKAINHGFIDIMNETWFCHTPINGQPCGLCTPCQVTIEHGLRRRIPLISQIRNFIHFTVKPPIKQLLKPAKKNVETPLT